MTLPDHRKPENMPADTIIGVRIGLALAVELLDRERVKVLAEGTWSSTGRVGKRAQERASHIDELGTRIFAIRDQYTPTPPASGARGE